jgi:hypothetical protein|tara:strand:+ start:438 stop:764 length:327 start_codon:yes stop_codon:yes gene_type:complete
MREADLETTTWYNPDYRSWPSGIGFIHKPNGEEVLVSDSGCGPRNMEEAKREIKAEYLPTEVEHISGEIWENREKFGNILKKHGVTHVVDYENHSGAVTLSVYLEGFK